MARFAFRLDPVLTFRERIENERQVVFAATLARRLEAENRRDELIAARAALRERIRLRHTEMDGDELRATYAHADFLDREIVRQTAVVAERAVETNAERERLVAASRDKKVLETLRRRRRDAYDLEAAATDQRETDDINARRYDRAHAHLARETPS
jgi:flagellar export protein FliJ